MYLRLRDEERIDEVNKLFVLQRAQREYGKMGGECIYSKCSETLPFDDIEIADLTAFIMLDPRHYAA
jgi:hypothetical protein